MDYERAKEKRERIEAVREGRNYKKVDKRDA